MANEHISPQGYEYGEEPKSTHPFWDDNGDGENGATFTPELTPFDDETGKGYIISWTNDGDLPNPEPVKIFDGTDGTNGTDGADGAPGQDGTDGTNGTNGATFTPVLTPTSNGYTLSWTNDGGLPNPQSVNITNGQNGQNGADGQDGTDGVTPNVQATATVDGSTGTPACQIVRTGTNANPLFTFNFTGIKGAQGTPGANGQDGQNGSDGANGVTFTPTVTPTTGGYILSWTNDGSLPNPNPVTILDGVNGQDGQDGTSVESTIYGYWEDPDSGTILNSIPGELEYFEMQQIGNMMDAYMRLKDAYQFVDNPYVDMHFGIVPNTDSQGADMDKVLQVIGNNMWAWRSLPASTKAFMSLSNVSKSQLYQLLNDETVSEFYVYCSQSGIASTDFDSSEIMLYNGFNLKDDSNYDQTIYDTDVHSLGITFNASSNICIHVVKFAPGSGVRSQTNAFCDIIPHKTSSNHPMFELYFDSGLQHVTFIGKPVKANLVIDNTLEECTIELTYAIPHGGYTQVEDNNDPNNTILRDVMLTLPLNDYTCGYIGHKQIGYYGFTKVIYR